MAEIISGKAVAAKIKEDIKRRLEHAYESETAIPALTTIRVGEKPDDIAYEQGVNRSLATIGMITKNIVLPADATEAQVLKEITEANEDAAVNGILLFKPLPKHLNEERLCNAVSVEKDVDCLSDESFARIALDKPGFLPCTAQAVMEILDYMETDLTGKRVVIIGRSKVVGKPLGLMMLKRNATVTWCHSKTKDIPAVCENADIIVVAVGRAGFLKAEHVKNMARGGIVIDVGINAKPDNTPGICGDADFNDVEPYVSFLTPVPGGVGSVTSAVMAKHLAESIK